MDIAITTPSKEKCATSMINNSSHARISITLEDIFTEKNLYQAYLCARKSKRKRFKVFNFELNLCKNLIDLKNSILNQTYQPQSCHEFDLWCKSGQKIRHITAPAFGDCVAQFCLYNALYPLIDKHLIDQNCGCRKNKGCLYAGNLVQKYIRHSPKNSHYLQTDISKYYYSIDKSILKKHLSKYIQDTRIINLILLWCNKDKGLNVGSVISQFLGAFFLNYIDHYIKRVLKIKHYIRYVDDMVFVGLSKDECYTLKDNIILMLATHKLKLSKWKIQPITKGINFVGYRTKAECRILRKRVLKTFNKNLKTNNCTSLESILALAQRTSTYSFLIKKLITADKVYTNFINRRINKWLTTHTNTLKQKGGVEQ